MQQASDVESLTIYVYQRIKPGLAWYQQVPAGTSRYQQVPAGTSRYHQVPAGTRYITAGVK